MVKRRIIQDDSDSEAEQTASSPPANKRARTVDSGGDDEIRSSAEPKDEQDLDSVMRAIGEQDQDDYEDGDDDAIHSSIRNKTKHGSVAQAGIIQSLDAVNFMCHRSLHFDFGPQVNFITGRNGSGKSAVLSGLQVGLGARTFLTGRGSNARNLIKDGAASAEVTVKIKNKGPEAYKPDIFGPTISVVRKILRSGGGGWAMKNHEGKTISTSKRAIQEMSDHMNIQIDSPLSVLTQDAAKQFLTTSSPQAKYAFFLQGTQLAQLTEEYELVKQNIKKIDTTLTYKAEVIPQLVQAAREAKAKLGEASKARDQAHKIDSLKKELAWSHVASKHKELVDQREAAEKLEKNVKKYLARAEESMNKIVEVQVQADQREAELTADKASDAPAEAERAQLRETIKRNGVKIQEFKSELRGVNESLTTINGLIRAIDVKLEVEAQKLQSEEAEKRARMRDELEQVQTVLLAKEAELANLEGDITRLNSDMQRYKADGMGAANDRRRLEGEIDGCVAYQRSIQDSQKSKYNAFGKNIESVLRDINQATWRGTAPPLGPLGLFVTLKDSTYRELLQTQLGGLMLQFVVSSVADRPLLQNILKKHGNSQTQIIIAEPDLFDFSAGVPSNPSTLTPLHVLDFTNEWVKRLFINGAGIEKIGLTKTRFEAQESANTDVGRVYWSADCNRVLRYQDGGSTSTALQPLHNNDPRKVLFQSGNHQADVQQAIEKEKELRDKREVLLRLEQDRLKQYKQAELEVRAGEIKKRNLYSDISKGKRRREFLEEQSKEEAPVEVAALEDEKASHVKEKETILAQFDQIEAGRRATADENEPLVKRADDLRERANGLIHKRNIQQAEIEKLFEEGARLKKAQTQAEDKAAEYQRELRAVRLGLDLTETEYDSWKTKATDFCDGEVVNNPRQTEAVQKEIEALTKALKQREKRHGASVEEMETECERAERAVKDAQAKIAAMTEINLRLKSSLQSRMLTWHAFRRAIALRAKIQFQYHLSVRGFTGQILFDHSAGTLNLSVKTNEQTELEPNAGKSATQKLKAKELPKDMKSLSGGEKSYSQICLLLALWESVGCPIRCLDEFDVFMDSVNRGISMKLMMDTAISSESKQYIFISPLDITTYVPPGNAVKILRMRDPERGQTSLDRND